MFLAVLSLLTCPWLVAAKVHVTSDLAHLSSSLELSHLGQGLAQAKTSIGAFQDVLRTSNMSAEIKELLRVVVKSGEYQVKTIEQLFDKLYQSNKRSRRKRQINPLHAVGDLVDWTFGLVSHSHLEQMRSSVEKSLNLVHSENNEIHSAIISNTKAINESVGTLQKFETFMNNLISTNDNLLQSDRFMLKIIRLKFELETCLKSLRDILTS